MKKHFTRISKIYGEWKLVKELDVFSTQLSEEVSIVDIFKFVNESPSLNSPKKLDEIEKYIFIFFQMDEDFLVQVKNIKKFYSKYSKSKEELNIQTSIEHMTELRNNITHLKT